MSVSKIEQAEQSECKQILDEVLHRNKNRISGLQSSIHTLTKNNNLIFEKPKLECIFSDNLVVIEHKISIRIVGLDKWRLRIIYNKSSENKQKGNAGTLIGMINFTFKLDYDNDVINYLKTDSELLPQVKYLITSFKSMDNFDPENIPAMFFGIGHAFISSKTNRKFGTSEFYKSLRKNIFQDKLIKFDETLPITPPPTGYLKIDRDFDPIDDEIILQQPNHIDNKKISEPIMQLRNDINFNPDEFLNNHIFSTEIQEPPKKTNLDYASIELDNIKSEPYNFDLKDIDFTNPVPINPLVLQPALTHPLIVYDLISFD